ncbi:hypothetical protein ADIS_0900 [Lunatimonas lonarensis]|uniref:Phosphatidic acid phosphatase type 2/haloperoxidase domain-containing protein n=1 Tax=Lunatimonas lonarensis TaxID=1232681 RepID=R7ZWM8_9BACT|nr:vanadium-dependent haloperoxidase [Lunatimonas lonarensis]EON78550.1 hypothetical protein ADIS_0900 [Lunatimonas lonarensis]
MRWNVLSWLVAFLVYLNSAQATNFTPLTHSSPKEAGVFIDHLFSVTEVMVTDVATPPGAARFYAYATLGAYAVVADLNPDGGNGALYQSFVQPFSISIDGSSKKNLNIEFCATYCMLEVGKSIMPSGKNLISSQEKLIDQYVKDRKIRKSDISRHIAYAKQVAGQVVAYASKDGYGKLSTLRRYSPSPRPGRWYPTPPAYMAAIDPEWRTLRTFFLTDLDGYYPAPPVPFSDKPESPFVELLNEVYSVTSQLTDEQKLIANFWDCNPFFVSYSGHMAIGIKKISPGGHWMGITGIASQQAGLSFAETVQIHTVLALSLHDAFVSCWAEKYQSDRIRPITAINKYIDESWQPLLQTPPFPEYTSGHSVISRVSARLLTDYFGDNFEFTDTSEVYFGLPERDFTSFLQAADEAAISRLYGGIHFRDAIEEGVRQGDKIADYVLSLTGKNTFSAIPPVNN